MKSILSLVLSSTSDCTPISSLKYPKMSFSTGKLSELNISGVSKLLSDSGLGIYSKAFETNEIDGKIFATLTDEDLRNSLDIKSFGARKSILALIAKSNPVLTIFKKNKSDQISVTKPSLDRFGRFEVPSSEGTEYKGTIGLPPPTRTLREDINAWQTILTKYVPLIQLVVADCAVIIERSISKRPNAAGLVCKFKWRLKFRFILDKRM